MEFHERMAIAHSLHTFWNPVSEEVVDDLLWALDPDEGSRVLDIACGAGELLVRMAERSGVRGVGVDVSPWALTRAREAAAQRAPSAELEFVEGPAEDYALPEAGPFDVVSLVGASWIWKGYRGTLEALHGFVKPGGKVLFGEPYWLVDAPPQEYLVAEGLESDGFTDLDGLRQAVKDAGFRLVYLVASSPQDWDRYEMLQSLATDAWAEDVPDHPDRAEVLAVQAAARRNYLRWGRATLGFAQMILRRVD